ncbi:MAG TPA: NUDIX domain-containing protein [Terriglobales bacterium]|nr:NUDIX domain-containing protein [Terriglobales bacterium]
MGASAVSRDPSRPPSFYQVAAVCYRRRGYRLEFLLVRTDKGRWSFPKGHLERELTSSQAAAREALEEAGAIGVIARRSFARYRHHKRALATEVTVRAYLLRVVRTVEPPETHRRPTWFAPRKARRKLVSTGKSKYRDELRSVLDQAVRLLDRETPGRHIP